MIPRPLRRTTAVLLAITLLAGACGGEDEVVEEPVEEPEPEPDDDAGDDTADKPEPEPEPEPEPVDDRPFSPLTGERVDEEVLERPLLLVKVPNTPPARPQAGLDAADVVYEEVVEGGATRFLAIFHSEVPDVVGPIRSARPVDTELMSGYGASAFAYSGARSEVQRMLAGTPSVRLGEGSAGFYRDASRSVPREYTLYIDAPTVLDNAVERGAEPFTEVGWEFDEDPPDGAVRCPPEDEACDDPGAAVDVRMSRSYVTGWEYDVRKGVYRRSQNNTPTEVTGSGRVGAANVVVLDTRHYVGASGYPETSVITEGAPAVVFRDGERFEARWEKPSADAPLRILTPDGDAFPLRPGATWVHLPDDLPPPPG